MTLMKRLPTLADVAHAAVFLASDHAEAITGVVAKVFRNVAWITILSRASSSSAEGKGPQLEADITPDVRGCRDVSCTTAITSTSSATAEKRTRRPSPTVGVTRVEKV
jgi:hypothetical protein